MRTVLKVETPVIVITGHGEGLSPSAMSAMIQGYLSKSALNPDTLGIAFTEALGLPEQQEGLVVTRD